MLKRILRSGFCLFFLLVAQTATAGLVLLSDSGTSPTMNVNPTIELPLGSTGSLYVWAQLSSSESIPGFSYNATTDTAGIISGTAHVVDNPTLLAPLSGTRWNAINPGTLGSLMTGSNSVKVGGGLSGSAMAFDPLYDAASGAYRVARLDFSADTLGTTGVYLGIGPQGIALGDAGDPIFLGFGDASVANNAYGATSTLADATVTVVPEPHAAALTAVAVLGMALLSRTSRPLVQRISRFTAFPH